MKHIKKVNENWFDGKPKKPTTPGDWYYQSDDNTWIDLNDKLRNPYTGIHHTASKCKKCGDKIKMDSDFCTNCGTPQNIRCKCGKAFRKDDKFCSKCGEARPI
jgi:predicted nucleic acid-binding Zn ribbon protein